MPEKAEIDRDAFAAFEHEGWENVCAGYEAHFGRLTRQSSGTLLDAAAVSGNTRLLDVCCGPGMTSAAAAARGARPVGLDFSAATGELAASLVPEARFQRGDAEDLPFEDGEFDAAVCGFGIIHLPDPHRGLRMGRDGKPFTNVNISNRFRKLCKKAEVLHGDKLKNAKGERIGLVFHSLRYSRTTAWIEAGLSQAVKENAHNPPFLS